MALILAGRLRQNYCAAERCTTTEIHWNRKGTLQRSSDTAELLLLTSLNKRHAFSGPKVSTEAGQNVCCRVRLLYLAILREVANSAAALASQEESI